YYNGALIYDSTLTNNDLNGGLPITVNVPYGAGPDDLVEIVMNEGQPTNVATAWNYTYKLLDINGQPYQVAKTNRNQTASGIAILGRDLYLAGSSEVNAGEGLAARYGLPMQDNAAPIWDFNWPDNKGKSEFNGIAVTSNGVYMVGDSYTVTMDDKSDGRKQ